MLELTDQNFETEVLNYQGLVLVDFWAPWCGPCRMVGPIIEELATKYSGKVKGVKVNVDTCSATANKFNIQGIPTVMLFKNGQQAESLIGAQTEASYENLLHQNLA